MAMAMIGGSELLIILLLGFVGLVVLVGIVAAAVLLSRGADSKRNLEHRLCALEQEVRQLREQKKE